MSCRGYAQRAWPDRGCGLVGGGRGLAAFGELQPRIRGAGLGGVGVECGKQAWPVDEWAWPPPLVGGAKQGLGPLKAGAALPSWLHPEGRGLGRSGRGLWTSGCGLSLVGVAYTLVGGARQAASKSSSCTPKLDPP